MIRWVQRMGNAIKNASLVSRRAVTFDQILAIRLMSTCLISGCGSPSLRAPCIPAPHAEVYSGDEDDESTPATATLPASSTLPRPRLLWKKTLREYGSRFSSLDESALTLAGPDHVKVVYWDGTQYREATLRRKTGDVVNDVTVPGPKAEKVSNESPGLVETATQMWMYGTCQKDPASKYYQLIWTENEGAGRHRRFVAPVITPDSVCYLKSKEVVCRAKSEDRIVKRWRLPQPFTGESLRHSELLIGEHRTALLSGSHLGPRRIVTWKDEAEPAIVLDASLTSGRKALLDGNTLFQWTPRDHVIAAYRLDEFEPALSTMAPQAAIAAIERETGGNLELLCSGTSRLPNFGDFWLSWLQKHSSSERLWPCALEYLTEYPNPTAGPLLRSLAHKTTDEQSLALIVEALGVDNDIETSRLLMNYTKIGYPTDKDKWGDRDRIVLATNEHLYRLGRTTDFGLCPTDGQQRPIAELDTRQNNGEIGTADPLIFKQIGHDGQWFNICQARQDTDEDGIIKISFGGHGHLFGDVARPYLIVGAGPGWAFDEFLAADPKGRYVAVRIGHCLELVDTQLRTATRLPNADLNLGSWRGSNRSAQFDSLGQSLRYIRGGNPQQIVIRQLTDGKEATFPGAQELLEADFEPDSRWLRLQRLTSGRKPQFHSNLAEPTCRGPVASSSSFVINREGKIEQVFMSLANGSFYENHQTIAVLPWGFLLKRPDGSIALGRGDSKEQVIVPTDCHGQIFHIDVERHSILVSCRAKREPRFQRDLWLFSQNESRYVGKLPQGLGRMHTVYSNRFVNLGDEWIDMEDVKIVDSPQLGVDEAVQVFDWRRYAQGIYAQRGDGYLLRVDAIDKNGDVAPLGPLRWRKP